MAETYMKTGDYAQAIRNLHEAIRLQPEHALHRIQLELCHAMKRDFQAMGGVPGYAPRQVYFGSRTSPATGSAGSTGYGKLPPLTAVIMAGAVAVLGWQYATVGREDEKAPPPHAIRKKRGTVSMKTPVPVVMPGRGAVPRAYSSVRQAAGKEQTPLQLRVSSATPGYGRAAMRDAPDRPADDTAPPISPPTGMAPVTPAGVP